MGKNQWVVQTDDGWGVRGEGNERLSGRYDTQKEAIDAARETARRQESELIIQGRDGKIRARDSYGNDPFPPKDES
ncbi:DUF2188 domain-containing protein [Pseudoalteromonas piscicida]|uniref:DUF2188 domain-containing protein n=1 Tax=Pseudoalteromonas piscicida TaxID=43662 RepID=UPI001C987591|nr:DUF2188 domain-containing protein [Pseudoalteromonas piscicida]QZO13360.1 DUF2188 domain-containing protein [Pseudoalteromonas piscicida]